MHSGKNGARRVIVVANRLPVSVQKSSAGIDYLPSSGGLATGLRSLQHEFPMVWVGWPGHVPRDRKADVEQHLASTGVSHPVFLSDPLIRDYYEGYANRTIWPIFHSLPTYARFSAREWEAYKRANLHFAQAVAQIAKPGDRIWIHDYQLMLLPRFLRELLPQTTLGFFLHIPFPDYEIFRLLPQRTEILESLLALDLAGFHTHDYAQAFLSSVRRLLGHENTIGTIMVGDRAVQAEVFPMGIDYAHYHTAAGTEEAQEGIASVMSGLPDTTVVFSVSRLDYTKGIPESIEAIAEFFKRYPAWRERLVYVLVVVPSRENVERYASLKREIDEGVGRVNSTFGTLGWQPIRYIYRSLSHGELVGLYQRAAVALITPLRDGMNLIAKEFLAVKGDGPGVLVLSEMAGAARELLEALRVNPNAREEVAVALHRALTMPEEEQRRRNAVMKQRLETYDVRSWADRYLRRLAAAEDTSRALAVRTLDSRSRSALVRHFTTSESRLLLLDYDGTLVPFAREPGGAHPDPRILEVLGRLAGDPRTVVAVLSGRDRHTLEAWLGDLPIDLVAEHGGWVRPSGETAWAPALPPEENDWKKDIRPIMDLFVDRIPGSHIEEKVFALVWHYRNADPEIATDASRELLGTLSTYTLNLSIQVLPGTRTVEVRHTGIGKGRSFTRGYAQHPWDFILALGDDWTDEDLFAALPPTAYSIKVGLKTSFARHNVRSLDESRALLEALEATTAVPVG